MPLGIVLVQTLQDWSASGCRHRVVSALVVGSEMENELSRFKNKFTNTKALHCQQQRPSVPRSGCRRTDSPMRRHNSKHTVRRFQEGHGQHGLRDRYDSGQNLSKSLLHTQQQRGVPELHLVLLVPSSGVETTVRAVIAQPRRSVETTVRAVIAQPRRSSIAVTFGQCLCYSGIRNNIRKSLYNYIITKKAIPVTGRGGL
jgi:hypothetical protein